jgi:8-oxo-dGTP diphosphatase
MTWTTGDFPALGPIVPTQAPPGAQLILTDAAGRLLMQLRDDWPGVVWPGKWSLFGGSCEAGETLAGAALRELREETGLVLEPAVLTPFARVQSVANARAVLHCFRVGVAVLPHEVRLGEGAGFAFLTPAQALAADLVPTIRPVVRLFCTVGGDGTASDGR